MNISSSIIKLTQGVTNKWAKQRKAEERHASAAQRRRQSLVKSHRVSLKEAAWEAMEEAYLKASNNGTHPANARQIMYAARSYIQEQTGRILDAQYFTQTLLPDYLTEYPDETADWDVVFDDRGHLTEPHTELVVPLGTVNVREYLEKIEGHEPNQDALDCELLESLLNLRFPTVGPPHRFQAILFIEKEGFMPLFKAVRLAERYDLAIMSTKGLSSTASRHLVDWLCGEYDIPLLVLHDFDKAGFSIIGTFRRATRRYAFENDIQVIDLGLRLADVKTNDLQDEEVSYGKSDPRPNLGDNGANEEEIQFLCQSASWDGYSGRRVELNAFMSADLVAWIEAKLEENGIKKIVPDLETVEIAYRRALGIHELRRRIEEIGDEISEQAKGAEVPAEVLKEIQARLKNDPAKAWDDVVAEIAKGHEL